MWESAAERLHCRQKAFAYQSRVGQPALFVTPTPNVANSFVMAQYTRITSVDTVFGSYMSAIPTRRELRSASMINDVASARLFMRYIAAFIDHYLGIDPVSMKRKPFDGLFGSVKAYFGMVETQGGCTLHAHFLLWLDAVPPNSVRLQRCRDETGDQFVSGYRRSYKQYR